MTDTHVQAFHSLITQCDNIKITNVQHIDSYHQQRMEVMTRTFQYYNQNVEELNEPRWNRFHQTVYNKAVDTLKSLPNYTHIPQSQELSETLKETLRTITQSERFITYMTLPEKPTTKPQQVLKQTMAKQRKSSSGMQLRTLKPVKYA
jgi:hypothetical protein